MGLEDIFNSVAGPSRARAPVWPLKLTPLSRPVQAHLQRVYATLAAALLACAGGVWLSALVPWTSSLAIIGALVLTPWLLLTPPSPATKAKRQCLLGGVALSQGAAIGPLVNLAAAVAPGVLLSAFLGTAAVFACFSAAALASPRRQFLYLGGLLSSAVSALLVLRFGSWVLGGGRLAYSAELYVGLVVFSGYVVFDTQAIVERADAGMRDELRDALELFTDAVAIFVRLLIILLRNAAKEAQRGEDKRDRKQKRRLT
eukprot:scaffold16.g28.t1